jgi:uncharacterized protein
LSKRHALSAETASGAAVVGRIVAFGRVLREAGLEVGPGRIADAVGGLDTVSIDSRDDVYWTLRQTLVSRREDIEAFDRAFAEWFFSTPEPLRQTLPSTNAERVSPRVSQEHAAGDEQGEADDETTIGWSPDERLRRKDFADLDDEERARLRVLIAELAHGRPQRRSRRLRHHPSRGSLDFRHLIRSSLATGGDPVYRTFRKPVVAPRKLIVLCDISGSMEAYARPMLLFVHALLGTGSGVEAFVFGTRLTRITDKLGGRDSKLALERAARRVVDWSSGTRIGVSLKAFNDEWGRRALSRGAVVVIVSDGWERDGTSLVAEEMARLSRCAYAIVWVNPLKGHPDYEPLAGGMRAALPYVDRFLPGNNLRSLEELAGVLASIARRHTA